MTTMDLNSDLGESFGAWRMGDDEAILRAHTEHMAAVIPGSKLVILPDASHFAMLQAPEEYTAAVRAFIDQ